SVARDGAFLAGDAAGGVDPVLGCGVALALVTGLAAGRAAVQVLAVGPGRAGRGDARLLRRGARLRPAVAGGLGVLAGRPRLPELVAGGFQAWPRGAARLARRVGGG